MSHSTFFTSRLAACALALVSLTISLSAFAEDRFKLSEDGQQVTDTMTNLVWRRCLEGQMIDGNTCKGKPTKFTYASAKKHVSELGHWRIPAKDELVSILNTPGKKKSALLDKIAFPTGSAGQVWSLRPETSDNLNAWIVNIGTGKVYGNPGSKKPYLLLVHSAG
jgi:hypothetical protein